LDLLTLINAIIFGLLGLIAGSIVGFLPGLNAALGIAILLPFTFGMDPTVALIFLGAIFTGGVYGGAITAILVNVPGAPSNIATCFDGYPMTKKGMAQEAICFATIAHATGGVIGILSLLLFAPLLAAWALKFGPAESFWTYIFGLTIVASISSGALIKGLIACAFGLLLSLVGLSPVSGATRFAFGLPDLASGVDLLPALIGFFGFAEAVVLLEGPQKIPHINYAERGGVFRRVLATIVTRMYGLVGGSALIGLFVGLLPGAGASIAAMLAYAEAKSFSAKRKAFGSGIPEGVVAPEAANSACVGGDLIPTLTLGIPGSAAAAVMVGGLIVHGMTPGPALFTTHSTIIYKFIAGIFIAQLMLIPVGVIGASLAARLLLIRPAYLAGAIMAMSLFGAFAGTGSMFGVIVMLFCGAVGYAFKKLDVPVGPAILGLILGKGIEESFMTSLQLGDAAGSIFAFFFTRPIAIVLILLCIISFAASVLIELKIGRERLKEVEDVTE
jgi:putative tricarboxylic transport membrane protein